MKTKTDSNNSPLAGLVNNSQDVIHNLTEHVRATAGRSRRLLDAKHRNDLLRELGQLHYDAHQAGDEPDQESVDRLVAQLENYPRDDAEHDTAGDGDD